MHRQLDSHIEDVKKIILIMGGHVEKALEEASQALVNKSIDDFVKVHELEAHINAEQIQVDHACFEVLAKQAPVAKDLRLILSIVKINTDLERMGDQTVNIAYAGRDFLNRKIDFNLNDINYMSTLARQMVKKALDSFVLMDLVKARETLNLDDEIDQLKSKVKKDVIAWMKTNPQHVEAGFDLILISRNLERLGDHATNIAEDVIFALTGQDIRHGGSSDE